VKKFAIHTLGCKINQYESTLIAENLKKYGFTLVNFKDVADFYIINTCTVTAEADRKSRQMVRQAKKRNPNSKVIVTGCYSNLNPEVFKDYTVIKNKMDIIKLIAGFSAEEEIIRNSFDKSRFFVKIEDGCNKFCTYCRIPYARGIKIKSKPIPIVLKEIELAIKNSYPEIVLTGINIGLYGKDFGKNFLDLLNTIDKNNYNVRFRISSIDPKDAYDILDFLAASKHFAHHLHISLQSGNDRILKLMNRGYTKKFFVNLLKELASSKNS
jgi:threonylcarbamoyladenosine tRNA methylthiotransferase MtaB